MQSVASIYSTDQGLPKKGAALQTPLHLLEQAQLLQFQNPGLISFRMNELLREGPFFLEGCFDFKGESLLFRQVHESACPRLPSSDNGASTGGRGFLLVLAGSEQTGR